MNKQEGLQLLPPGALQRPPASSEERVVIREVEIAMFKSWIRDLRDPIAGASNWATTFFGVAIGTLVTSWALPRGTQHRGEIFIAGIFALACCAFSCWVVWRDRATRTDEKAKLITRIDEMVKHCPRFTFTTEAEGPAQPAPDTEGKRLESGA